MIKQIEQDELEKCVKLIRESFLTVAKDFAFTEENAPRFTAFVTTYSRLEQQFNDEHRFMFGYFIDNELVGYYSLLWQDNDLCELNNLCVLPEYRHKNIGHELLEHAYHQAKENGRTAINISIVEENTVLRKWYEDNGYEHIGTKKFNFFPFTCGYMKRKISR